MTPDVAYDIEFDEMLNTTVTVAPVASRDEHNVRTYGTAVTYNARVVEELLRVIDSEGRETVSTHTAWLAPHATSGIPNLGPDARVTLADGTTPPILRITVVPDEDGDHHWKLFLGPSGGGA